MKELLAIQTELKAPKGQFNSFGNYKYRSCEDILEAVKPLLAKHNCVLTITDSIKNVGDRYYIEAKAVLSSESGTILVVGIARESLSKKGMDESQITGTASSYARKYALNGLFCIDDAKDSDFTNTHGVEHSQKTTKQAIKAQQPLDAIPRVPEEQMRIKITDMICEMYELDRSSQLGLVQEKIKDYSSFIGDNNKLKFKTSTLELKGKWLANVYKKVTEDFQKFLELGEHIDRELGDDSGLPEGK